VTPPRRHIDADRANGTVVAPPGQICGGPLQPAAEHDDGHYDVPQRLNDGRVVMSEHTPRVTSSDELKQARQAVLRGAVVQFAASTLLIGVVTFVALMASTAILPSASTALQAALGGAIAIALVFPVWVTMYRVAMRHSRHADDLVVAWEAQVASDVARREFETQVAEAFEMAATEPEALLVVERSLSAALPDQPVEVLLADNSHAHLKRLVVVSDDGVAPGCGVDSPNDCPAARRSRALQFPDSTAVNACPRLEGRIEGGCSALCLPVSVMGRTVGVIHTVGPRGSTVDEVVVAQIQAIANQTGARLGMIRILEESQLQASTDGLTGLLNRRALEHQFRTARPNHTQLAVVMADLDNFKTLNDTYGHETGDRSLRLFAETLRSTLRADDIVCRHGGEEFAVILPGCSAQEASALLERVREQLRRAALESGLPGFTASFGVVAGDSVEDLEALLRRADVALFEAKRTGRDKIVVNGAPTYGLDAPVDSAGELNLLT
jgi:diguanylate cyclase (GGDEF)-like protein